mgnify:CR=1 FL=1
MARRKVAVVDPQEAVRNIREARLRLGLNMVEAAERCGIGYQSWTDLERGRKGDGTILNVSLDRLWLIAQSLGIDPHDLDKRLASVRPSKGRAK